MVEGIPRPGEDELEEFFEIMRRVFRSNAFKGPWHGIPIYELLNKLEEERREQRDELRRDPRDPVRLKHESADVGLVAFMLWSASRHRGHVGTLEVPPEGVERRDVTPGFAPAGLPTDPELNKWVHTQEEPAEEWRIEHGVVGFPFILFFDPDGKSYFPGPSLFSDEGVTIARWINPRAGSALVVGQFGPGG